MKIETYKKRLENAQAEIERLKCTTAYLDAMCDLAISDFKDARKALAEQKELSARLTANIDLANILIDEMVEGEVPRTVQHKQGVTTLSLTERLAFVIAKFS